MAFNPRTKRVWAETTTIENLEHDFDWVSDSDINAMLLDRFRNYNYLTPSVTANTAMLQNVINNWHDYFDKLYETTIYDYDPLLNYDLREEGTITDEKHKGTKTSVATDATTTSTPRVERVTEETGFGVDSDATGTPVGKTTEKAPTGTDSTRVQGTATANYSTTEDLDATHFDKDVRTFDDYHKYGQIGTTKTQDLVQAERDLIIPILQLYVDKFKTCFDISTYINYEPWEEETP